MLQLFAPCAKGLEYLLVAELQSLGAEEVHEALAGVHFRGDLAMAYRAVLWSRLASRVFLLLSRQKVTGAAGLYAAVAAIDWQAHLGADDSLLVDFVGTNRDIKHTQFGAQTVKDAIVDQFRERCGRRPSVDPLDPTLRLNAHLDHDQLSLSIDLSGHSLHERGYRSEAGAAPLKETLAAAMLLRCGWPALAAEQAPLLDPLCGAGTLPIEAVLMATDTAPGLLRDDFACSRGWLGHDASLWADLRAAASERAAQGRAQFTGRVYAYDADPQVLQRAQANAERAGCADYIQFEQRSVADLQAPKHSRAGLVVANPPYGERLGDKDELEALYQQLGSRLLHGFQSWRAGVITSEASLAAAMQLRSHKQYALYNGRLACKLYLFDIHSQSARKTPTARPLQLSDAASAFRNRLQKNLQHWRRWAKRQQIDCYRVYDADLPDYAAAIDCYAGRVFVQEYQAPKSVPEALAAQRLQDIIAVAAEVFAVPLAEVQVRTRARQKGQAQYSKQATTGEFFSVQEQGLQFWVNLHDYLDTGLFLDHRHTRQLLRERAAGKRFLNLFAYTGTATVYAAAGGAKTTTSVDLSNTYLDWAERNLQLNQLQGRQHRFMQAEVLSWLQESRELYDLIFVDPPTFSNSKRMSGVFDVQRDHVALLQACAARLAPGGEIIFSTNFRKFKLDSASLSALKISDWNRQTQAEDFARNPKIHQCWQLSHGDVAVAAPTANEPVAPVFRWPGQ